MQGLHYLMCGVREHSQPRMQAYQRRQARRANHTCFPRHLRSTFFLFICFDSPYMLAEEILANTHDKNGVLCFKLYFVFVAVSQLVTFVNHYFIRRLSTRDSAYCIDYKSYSDFISFSPFVFINHFKSTRDF